MSTGNMLRKQVRTELKVRRYVVYTLLLLSICYMAGTLVFSDMGLLRYIELKKKQDSLDLELKNIMDENFKLKASIDSLKNDDFYVEKNARENFGLSGKDEYIFIYK